MQTIHLLLTIIPHLLTNVYWFKAMFIATSIYIYLNYWIKK